MSSKILDVRINCSLTTFDLSKSPAPFSDQSAHPWRRSVCGLLIYRRSVSVAGITNLDIFICLQLFWLEHVLVSLYSNLTNDLSVCYRCSLHWVFSNSWFLKISWKCCPAMAPSCSITSLISTVLWRNHTLWTNKGKDLIEHHFFLVTSSNHETALGDQVAVRNWVGESRFQYKYILNKLYEDLRSKSYIEIKELTFDTEKWRVKNVAKI